MKLWLVRVFIADAQMDERKALTVMLNNLRMVIVGETLLSLARRSPSIPLTNLISPLFYSRTLEMVGLIVAWE